MEALELKSATWNQPGEQTARRREMLALYLVQLEEAQRSGADLQETLAGIDLDTWELAQLDQGLDRAANCWRALVAEGVAFRIKYETDVGWPRSAQQLSAEERADFRGILIADAAVGIALLTETQRAINQLILRGEMNEARKLTGFRNKIRHGVSQLRGHIGDEGYAEATSISEELVTPEEQTSLTESKPAPSVTVKRSSRTTGGRAVFKNEVRKSRLKPLLMLLGVCVAAWAVFILPKFTFQPLHTLTLSDISPRSEIRHVVARPPSLFIELDSYGWRALSKQQQLALVDDVGRTAAAAGYHGAQFKLENGKTAAQWLKERGSQLTD